MRQHSSTDCPFADAARRARRRLLARTLLAALAASSGWLGAGGVLALLVARGSELPLSAATLAAALLLGWTLGCALFAWRRTPDAPGALAVWDEAAGAHETLLSAYHFAQSAEPGEGEALHLARARGHLQERRETLASALPLDGSARLLLGPAALLLFAFSPLATLRFSPAPPPRETASAESLRRAGEEVRKAGAALETVKTPDPQEQKAMDELAKTIAAAAKRLQEGNQTQREALASLERTAREAEKLAQTLGGADDDALSAQMLAAMEQHAETDGLASAARAQSPGELAKQLENLAAGVEDAAKNVQRRGRIQKAFDETLAAATAQDQAKRLPRALSEAARELRAGNHAAAAQALRRLSREYQKTQRQQGVQKKLQQLAQQLRGAGQTLTGRLAPDPRLLSSLKSCPAGSCPLPTPGLPRALTPGSGAPPSGFAPPPANSKPGSCSGGACTPVPGTRPGKSGSGLRPVPGTMPGTGRGGAAPVPGAVPGSGACQTPGAGQGGSRAGSGSAAMEKNQTARQQATKTDTLAGTPGQGPSSVRNIEGSGRAEAAQTATQASVAAQIDAAEAGLDDEPLPLSRRDEVRRYFTIMRLRAAEGTAP